MVDASVKTATTVIKFLCSYGGKILPRYPDGKLRYVGGETRVLAVDRSAPFSELLLKLGELYGSPVSFRCQLPTEDLDALVSITCDEDLTNLIEEYDRANRERSAADPLKIRSFLAPPKSKITPASTAYGRKTQPSSAAAVGLLPRSIPGVDRCVSPHHHHHHISPPVRFPVRYEKPIRNRSWLGRKPAENGVFLVHHGNHGQ